MERIVFKSKYFYYLVLFIISIFLISNAISLFTNFELKFIPALVIQSVLMFLIITKNKYAKISLKLWITVFFIIGFSLQFIGSLLKYISGDSEIISSRDFFIAMSIKLFFVIIGVIILVLTNKTTEIQKI